MLQLPGSKKNNEENQSMKNEIYNVTETVARAYSPSLILSLFGIYQSRLIGRNAEACRHLKADLLSKGIKYSAADIEDAVKFAEERRKSVQFQKVIPLDRFNFGAFALTLCYVFALQCLDIDQTVLTALWGVIAVSFLAVATCVYRRSSVAITSLHILERLHNIHRLSSE
jgi:hypothetical protein